MKMILTLLMMAWAALAQPIEVRIDDETAPAGAAVQLKVGFTDPHPISTGKVSALFDESYFDSIYGVAMWSPLGDVAGAAVVQGSRIAVRFTSPLAGVGTVVDYPLLSVVIGTKPGTAVGTKRDLQLDAAETFWKAVLGDDIPFTVKKGLMTTGGTLFVSNVVPGGGVLPAGTVVNIVGGGFTPGMQVLLKKDAADLQFTSFQYVNPNLVTVTLTQSVDLAGARVELRKSSPNERVVYYSYLRTTQAVTSGKTLLNQVEPLFAVGRRMSGYVAATPPSGSSYVGVAFENDSLSTVNVNLDLVTGTGTPLKHVEVSMPSGTRHVREVAEIFGMTPPAGSGVVVSAATAIHMLGLGADDGTRVVTPILVGDAPAPQLVVTPGGLTFQYQMGGAVPVAQGLNVTATGSGLGFQCVAGAGTPWLGVVGGVGTTPALVSATVAPAGMGAGSYPGSITCTAAGANPVVVPVTLNVTAAPGVVLSPASVGFAIPRGGAAVTQTVTVGSGNGNAVAYTVAVGAGSGGWLTVTPAGGTTPGQLSVTANVAGLAVGTYTGSIVVSGTGFAATLAVELVVTTPTLVASPAVLSFQAVVGGAAPVAQTVQVTSNGGSVNPVFSVTPGAGWLTVGQSGAGTPLTLTVGVNAAGLSSGTYTATITGTGGATPLTIPVTLVVAVAGLQNPATLLTPAEGTTLGASATFTWTNTGAVKYRLDVGRTAGGADIFSGESTGTTLTVNGLPQDGSTVYVQLATYFTAYLTPVVRTYAVGGGSAARFVAVAPCRLVDTRNAPGLFGGPEMGAGSTRDFVVPAGGCGIPAGARAYSLNITVVPAGPLSFLTAWPAGQTRPLVSTLNAFDGGVASNAAIVPAGANGAVSIFVTDRTHVVIDINGYFVGSGATEGLVFYPVTPCRVADTRNAVGTYGGPTMAGGTTRDFPIAGAACGIPAGARAYALNMTVVPSGALSYLTTYPAGQTRPLVSTLNAFDGAVKANAAIVPAGAGGAISVFVTDRTDVVMDISGYFAPPGTAGPGLLFYAVTPCRVADTRNAAGPYGGPVLAGGVAREIAIGGSGCGVPAGAQAYGLNVTVVPSGALSYLTAWPAGGARPTVSTLNSPGGKVLANAAIVPAGTGGAVSFFATDATHLVIDLNGYFAP